MGGRGEVVVGSTGEVAVGSEVDGGASGAGAGWSTVASSFSMKGEKSVRLSHAGGEDSSNSTCLLISTLPFEASDL